MSKKFIAIALVLTAVGIPLTASLVIDLLGEDTRPTPVVQAPASPPSAETSPQFVELQTELQHLRAENRRQVAENDEMQLLLTTLSDRMGALEAAEPMAQPGAAPERPSVPKTPEDFETEQAEQIAREDQEVDDQFQLLDTELSAERIDPAWSESATQSVIESLAKVSEQGLWLEHADCRTSFCRIDVGADPSASEDEILHAFRDIDPWSGEAFLHIENGVGTIYMAREGHRLPRIAQAAR
ncbi:MAG: hypothetical protein JRG96_16475 [Deltaproteobacteria bacterium]|nr:hypothetical protein [Deltaproteobacteria bacterium]MBW2419760.1 hypothetical protein [Deltaproteobacteria bacterium]